jgi:predicted amidohydrolase
MALNRQALVEARTRHLQRLNDLSFDIAEALDEAAVAAPAQRARPLQRAARKRAQLLAMAGADEEFTAMTRAFVAAAEGELLARYRELLESKAEQADAVGA